MKIQFDTKNLKGLTLSQFFLLSSIESMNYQSDTKKDKEILRSKGYLDEHNMITDSGKDILKDILSNTNDIEIDKLAKELREIYPKGMMPGTNYKWTSNPREIMDKLKRFFILFSEEKITCDEVIQATKNYLQKMEYSPYMRLLKYFILKTNVDKDKESDLYSEICLLREGENNAQYDNTLI